MILLTKKNIIGLCVLVVLLALVALFLYEIKPASGSQNASTVTFEIKQGDGFRFIASQLASDDLIRSKTAFELFALISGHAFDMQPGLYRLSPTMGSYTILKTISGGNAAEVTVTIPEDANIYEIDSILSNALVIHPGDLINFHADGNIEGKLFPDTYQFYTGANVSSVVEELMDTFNAKALPLLNTDPKNVQQNLILASILEKEVPDQSDQEIVAGILLKRLAAGIALDVDATVCYAKIIEHMASSTPECYPLTALDFKIDSPYNTYLYKGLPPGPIGSPGVSAIMSALNPQSSPYWYYLSDPTTGKTIFAKTLDEQNQNKVKYLKGD